MFGRNFQKQFCQLCENKTVKYPLDDLNKYQQYSKTLTKITHIITQLYILYNHEIQRHSSRNYIIT